MTQDVSYFPGRFAGKVLLVTGAAQSSIGGCVAIRAAREGARVVCVDRKVEATRSTVTEILGFEGEALFFHGDVSKASDCDAMVATAVESYGSLDLVVNAAGVMDGTDPVEECDFARDRPLLPAPVATATDEYWHRVFATNIHGVFYSMRAQLRQMVAQGRGGAVVNVASIAGLTGLPGNCAYSASKHAVNGLTRSAALDYAAHGIRVNSVNMAQTETPMVDRARDFVRWASGYGQAGSMASLKSRSLLQPSAADPGASPWEQAAIILFLLSGDASNITGALYATDGGWTAY
jgi:NAD(P)-dependent dehydrogenase (short-subunit alcohol dehydrogenase family)